MSQELEILQNIPIFSKLSTQDMLGVDLVWELRTMSKGETLWYQGAPADALAIVLQGALHITINQQVLATIYKMDIVGELATFTNNFRSASVQIAEDATLLILSKEALFAIRDTHWRFYERLLHLSLERIAKRIQDTNAKISRSATDGIPLPLQADGFFFQWAKKWNMVSTPEPPSAISALRKLPGLKNVHPTNLQVIMKAMKPVYIRQGKELILEGQTGTSAFLLVEGVIDVYRNTKRNLVQHLVSLYPGALLGTGALILDEKRNASCLASANTNIWVYEMSRADHDKLEGEPSVLWGEALLHSLAFQLRTADDVLVLAKQGHRPDTDYDKARGVLSGYQGQES